MRIVSQDRMMYSTLRISLFCGSIMWYGWHLVHNLLTSNPHSGAQICTVLADIKWTSGRGLKERHPAKGMGEGRWRLIGSRP